MNKLTDEYNEQTDLKCCYNCKNVTIYDEPYEGLQLYCDTVDVEPTGICNVFTWRNKYTVKK